jgi:hypothetical protein
MNYKIEPDVMLRLQKGCKLICLYDYQGLKSGLTYTFESYDDSIVPKNRENAVMAWYPDKPLWTPERYEFIRYNFMRIKLEGVETPVMLKFFELV